jgi:hypothetical protein
MNSTEFHIVLSRAFPLKEGLELEAIDEASLKMGQNMESSKEIDFQKS